MLILPENTQNQGFMKVIIENKKPVKLYNWEEVENEKGGCFKCTNQCLGNYRFFPLGHGKVAVLLTFFSTPNKDFWCNEKFELVEDEVITIDTTHK